MKPLQPRTSLTSTKGSLLDGYDESGSHRCQSNPSLASALRPGSGHETTSLSAGTTPLLSPNVSGPLPNLARLSRELPPPSIRVEAGHATQVCKRDIQSPAPRTSACLHVHCHVSITCKSWTCWCCKTNGQLEPAPAHSLETDMLD